jgi:hypothetical protein
LAEGETDAMFVTRVADGKDAQADEFFEAGKSEVEKLSGRLPETGGAAGRVELAAFEEEVSVRVDETGEQGVLGKVGIRCVLARAEEVRWRGSFADEVDLIVVVDDVGVAEGSDSRAIEQSSDTKPDAMLGGGGGEGGGHIRCRRSGLRRRCP